MLNMVNSETGTLFLRYKNYNWMFLACGQLGKVVMEGLRNDHVRNLRKEKGITT